MIEKLQIKITGVRGFELIDSRATMPTRSTSQSAGYDLFANESVLFEPYETKIVKTGVRAYMRNDEFLAVHLRSSMAAKRGFILANGVGIVDADYYPHEIGIILTNHCEHQQSIGRGEKIAQGVFSKYLFADDDDATCERDGGFGSTGR